MEALLRPAPGRHAAGARPKRATTKVLVPVTYSAWLMGDLGQAVERQLRASLDSLHALRVTRLPRHLVVEADEAPGPLLEAVHRAVGALEESMRATYPVFHHELGPVWTGTLQTVFDDASALGARRGAAGDPPARGP